MGKMITTHEDSWQTKERLPLPDTAAKYNNRKHEKMGVWVHGREALCASLMVAKCTPLVKYGPRIKSAVGMRNTGTADGLADGCGHFLSSESPWPGL